MSNILNSNYNANNIFNEVITSSLQTQIDNNTTDITGLNNRITDTNVEIGQHAGQQNHSTYGIAIGYNAGRHTQGEDGISIGREAGHSLQGVNSIAIGYLAGYKNQASQSVAIGYASGNTAQGQYSVAVGNQAGQNDQGANSVAVGNSCGYLSQGLKSVAIGDGSGFDNQEYQAIAIGYIAGYTNQGINTISIGTEAGKENQQVNSIAIGNSSGKSNQNYNSVAIGVQAGQYNQQRQSIAIGEFAGNLSQGTQSIAIGASAGYTSQNAYAVAIGKNAGYDSQNSSAVAIGDSAGYSYQKNNAVAIGSSSGLLSQGLNSVAIGYGAGSENQNQNSVSLGSQAGQYNQNINSVAIGNLAGNNNQNSSAIAIGYNAGIDSQGQYSVAIGYNAGRTNQSSQSIAINASTSDLVANQQGIFINPVRNVNSNQNIITYNTSSKELTYDSSLYSTIMNNYMTSDNFYLYPPTSAYRVMSLQPSMADDNTGGFKKNFYLVPFNATITDIIIENVGESNTVKYDIRITKQSGATTTSTTDTITMTSALTNPSGIENYCSVSYYTNSPTYNSYLVHYYPFSYNFINVADQINYRSLIGTGSFTQEVIKVGIASYEFNPFNSLSTYDLISLCGSGSTNTSSVTNSNGYTLISFWLNVKHCFLANSQSSLLFTTRGIGTGTQYQNKNFDVYLKNAKDGDTSSETGDSYTFEISSSYNWSTGGSTNDTLNSGARVISNNSWNHIALYITPQRFILYVNGQTWIYSNSRQYAWDASYLTLGNYNFSNTTPWTSLYGFMNDLRVYNSTSDYLSDWASYSTLGTTYPKINDYFNTSNITTSSSAVGNSNFISLASPVSVVKGDRIYMELRENTDNSSNFDELVSAKLLLKAT
jgi:hypothetical protein